MIENPVELNRQYSGGKPAPLKQPTEAQQVEQLISLFNSLFLTTYNTELVKGESEPVYLPASDQYPHHRIIFAHGFFNSALHEIAHWCVAGEKRRLLEDFGYWYEPDGRTLEQQRAFERVEIKPQALEWIFAKCCGRRFRVSVDNLSLAEQGVVHNAEPFKKNVYLEVHRRLREGLPPRARLLANALIEQFQPGYVLAEEDFRLEDL